MKVLGIETSCDECAAAVVEDGQRVLSNIIHTQIPFHAAYNGVVPEIAGRKHIEWIQLVVKEAVEKAGCGLDGIDAVAASSRPGLLGSLLVGLNFAKAFAWAKSLPFIAVDHILAHLYACNLENTGNKSIHKPVPKYPFLGLMVSGGHSFICRSDDFDDITVLGATIDDACDEAFDKVSKHYGFGYPGGAVIDKLAQSGNPKAYNFPLPNLKTKNICDFSFSGLKTAAIHQFEQFRINEETSKEANFVFSNEDLAASFQKTAVDILLRGLFKAVESTGIKTIVAGGGVAANSLLRTRLQERSDLVCVFPPLEFCGDNAAMVAGIGYQYLVRGETSPLSITASARVKGLKRMLSRS